jgi:uncharacterized protein (DUF849 family)
MKGDIRLLQACLNGKRSQAEFPAVPVTPDELAADAAAAVAAGAEAIHLHARGRDGAESVRAGDVGAAVAAVRVACPGTPVGVSTGLWITRGDAAARQAAVSQWADLAAGARPDFASVNVSEDGWAGVVRSLGGAGIAAEAGVWSVTDVQVLARAVEVSALAPLPLRILIEVMGEPADSAPRVAEDILRALDDSPLGGLPRLLHGEGEGCWPLVAQAAREGLLTRIGLEDTTAGPGGEPVSGNAELVRLALAVLRG